MKFVNPELEITMFSVEDILTSSQGGSESEVSALGRLMEGSCTGTAADDLVDNCV